MYIKILIGSLVLSLVVISCRGSKSKISNKDLTIEEVKNRVLAYEDSIMTFQKSQKVVPAYFQDSLINALKLFYSKFPEDKSAAKCLDKIQMFYSGNGQVQLAVKYADTLIEKFPKYKNRSLVLESQAANYDMFINPRDTNKVKQYFTMLLKENKSMETDKRKGIELRLRHLELTFEEFIQFQSK
ncbi:MAG: hypothetical protein HYR91_06110 [Flavobacteriia bacterium]|nr:hypothetical protein [Flavobacteriia bacterium]